MLFPRQEIIQIQLLADRVLVTPGVNPTHRKSWLPVILAAIELAHGNVTQASHALTTLLKCTQLDARDMYVFHISVQTEIRSEDAARLCSVATAMGIPKASRKTMYQLKGEIKAAIE